jgi:hypothetical protein
VKLTELNPHFLKRGQDESGHEIWRTDVGITEADGVEFLCPKCFVANSGSVGTHAVICWNPSVSQTVQPTPGRWDLVGTGFDDLSLVAGSSSILLQGEGCQAHFFIRNGEIQ